MKQTRSTLKTYFERGDKPTEGEFADLIDSMLLDGDLAARASAEFLYADLTTLIANNALVVGQKYTISDYQTRYYIEGTNTTNINREAASQGVVSGFAFFDPPLDEVSNGTPIEVVSLPADYTGAIQVGDTATVTSFFSGFYMKFTNGLHTVDGATFKYSIKRFDTIDEDAVIIDGNSKVMMKPNGVINTEVHNGTPYMQMTAEENKAVPFEKIVLTAISGNSFAKEAESATYPGEILEYDFNDTEIKNEDEVVIGQRKGLIKRRISADRRIDVNKDWRVQRYRRYKLSDSDWINYILQNTVDSTLYNVGSNHAFTLSNVNINEDHRYILPAVENKDFYQDFTTTGTVPNVFLDGISNGSSIVYGQRMETAADDVYKIAVNAVLTDNGKDLLIFPLDAQGEPKDTVTLFKVNTLENTVFRNNNGQYIEDQKITVNITDGISQSSFMAGGAVFSSSPYAENGLIRITAIDNVIELGNKGRISDLIILGTCILTNSGNLNFVTMGGMAANATPFGVTYADVSFDSGCQVRNTMIGGKRVDKLVFNNVYTNKCLFGYSRGQYLKISDSIMFLTAFKHAGDFFTNNLSIDTSDQNIQKGLFGFLYEGMPNLSGKYIFNSAEGDLVYRQANVTDLGDGGVARSLGIELLTRAK
ncbi:hypothetical protein ACFO3O_19925 [Dokdonia ponticola]|uniref:Uncharacterized protein n=1 Tax=Dokdonia ponticola TaxID=2041041 RepID=A0ABV9I382_9FLAO